MRGCHRRRAVRAAIATRSGRDRRLHPSRRSDGDVGEGPRAASATDGEFGRRDSHLADFSFPSGHVIFGTVLFGTTFWLVWTVWPSSLLRNSVMVALAAPIFLMCPSRVHLGRVGRRTYTDVPGRAARRAAAARGRPRLHSPSGGRGGDSRLRGRRGRPPRHRRLIPSICSSSGPSSGTLARRASRSDAPGPRAWRCTPGANPRTASMPARSSASTATGTSRRRRTS
jgi:hypothetical protein